MVLLALLGALAFGLGGTVGADASVLSRGARGWLAARRYLEAKGRQTTLLDQPLERVPVRGVLVLAFPWQRFAPDEDAHELDLFLHAGGAVVLAFSGDEPGFGETEVLRRLGLVWSAAPERPPLHPLRWREFVAREWWLVPEEGHRAQAIWITAPRRVPRAPDGAAVLYRGEKGVPAVFSYPRGEGRVVVLPAEALANARLGTSGNADLLETLRRSLGERWTFDEFHHGLSAPLSPADAAPRRVLDLYLLHLAFLYVLVVAALVRRFGPAWSEPAVIGGSTRSFLVGLGRFHHRLGHHRDAARLLLARAQELDPRCRLEPALTRAADEAGAAGVVAVANAVARAQSHRSNG